MAGGHAWLGACMAEGVHGGGHVWWRGMCGQGACVAGGHVWQGACVACMPPRADTTATAYGQ